MTAPSNVPMPDFNKMAAQFDRFLSQIHPVTVAVLERLSPLAEGATVLDVACGTGEPGLTLARRSPGVRLLGVDAAPAMIEVARGKAAREPVENARFEVMSSDALSLPDESVDAVIGRFGLLMFGDVRASAREMARVLKRGGVFSLAVWDDIALNTLVYSLTKVLGERAPKGQESPLLRLQEWAGEETRARVLTEAGISEVRSEMFTWMYDFDSFDQPWDLVSRMGMTGKQAGLPEGAEEQIKSDLESALSAYRQPSGGYRIPHTCRLFWGQR